jgi:hypothetical protein
MIKQASEAEYIAIFLRGEIYERRATRWREIQQETLARYLFL